MGFKLTASNLNNYSQNLHCNSAVWFQLFHGRQREAVCANKSKYCHEFVYIAVNSKIILEVVYCIMLVALVRGQPNYTFMRNSHTDSVFVLQ